MLELSNLKWGRGSKKAYFCLGGRLGDRSERVEKKVGVRAERGGVGELEELAFLVNFPIVRRLCQFFSSAKLSSPLILRTFFAYFLFLQTC